MNRSGRHKKIFNYQFLIKFKFSNFKIRIYIYSPYFFIRVRGTKRTSISGFWVRWPSGSFWTRMRFWILRAGPTGMHILPEGFSCSMSGWGMFSGAQVTMMASKGACSGQPR